MHCFGLHVQHEQYKKSSAAVLEYVPLNNNKSFASWNMESVRLVASTDDSYDASQHLSEVHAAVQAFDTSQSQRRNLDALDLFAGRAAFKHTARDSGLTAESVEMTDDLINQNLLTRAGFFYVLNLICRLVPRSNKP